MGVTHLSATPPAVPHRGLPIVTLPKSLLFQALVFDMGDVLYDATLWRRWLWQLLARMDLHANYHSLFKIWDTEYLDAVHRGSRDYQQAFAAFLRSLGLDDGLIDEVEAASQARRRELDATLRPLPGVRATLAKLHAVGVPLAVLSDSESSGPQLEARLAKLGLADCFTAVVSSCDLKHTKPDSRCYAAALAALGTPSTRTAFVGHDAEELAGARRVGMPTIAFNYEPDAQADVYIERFEQLLDLVACANNLAAAG
jgi:HAD superfamily hydrolase (TIGR01509 family)